MESQSSDLAAAGALSNHPQIDLINTFCEITACASKSEALFFLESHGFDLDAAVSTFLDDVGPADTEDHRGDQSHSHYLPPSQAIQSEQSPRSRSRSPSPPPVSRSYDPRSSSAKPNTGASASSGRSRGGGGGIRTLADLSGSPKDADSDSDPDFDPQEYYTGGEKSGMLVQGPSKAHDVDEIFNQARQAGALDASSEAPRSSNSRGFRGTARLLSGEVSSSIPQPPESVTHTITFWRNGFTVDDGPLRLLDDPANASFLESIRKSECPRELTPADRRTQVQVNLIRKEEDYKEPEKPRLLFQGLGRTLGSISESASAPAPTTPTPTPAATPPAPSPGLVVDTALPITSIQLRLSDGTRMVSRFNNSHTIRDIQSFIDASRPNAPRTYQLQSMGFPPKPLTDLNQTIDEAGIANSVVIQKL